MEENKTLVHRVTLGSGKVVLLRELKIKHTELAAAAVGNKANGNQTLFSMLLQKELLKQLVVQINERSVRPIELEDIDSCFSMNEYGQLLQVIGKLADGDGEGSPQIEVVAFGGK